MCVCEYVCLYVCLWICVSLRVCVNRCVYICVCLCVYCAYVFVLPLSPAFFLTSKRLNDINIIWPQYKFRKQKKELKITHNCATLNRTTVIVLMYPVPGFVPTHPLPCHPWQLLSGPDWLLSLCECVRSILWCLFKEVCGTTTKWRKCFLWNIAGLGLQHRNFAGTQTFSS